MAARWSGRGRRREHRRWAGRARPRVPRALPRGPSQEGGVRSPAASLWDGLQEFRGTEAFRAGAPRPLLLGSGSDLPAGEPLSLEPLHVVASVAATVLSPASGLRGPSLAHTAQPPGVPLGPGQAQLPDGRGRPFRTRTLATLRFLGNLTVLRRKI